ncbi:thymidine kinase, partial [Mycoplasmopsis pullorum]
MFLKYPDGTLEVITGPMFAGKSEELIKRIKILQIADVKTLVFKPEFDNRFSDIEIVSRNGAKVKAININNSEQILEFYEKDYKAVVIDEIHFFDENII